MIIATCNQHIIVTILQVAEHNFGLEFQCNEIRVEFSISIIFERFSPVSNWNMHHMFLEHLNALVLFQGHWWLFYVKNFNWFKLNSKTKIFNESDSLYYHLFFNICIQFIIASQVLRAHEYKLHNCQIVRNFEEQYALNCVKWPQSTGTKVRITCNFL